MNGQWRTAGVVGAGSWGTALATVAAKAGLDTLLWARSPEVAQSIARHRENRAYLPGVRLPSRLEATSDLARLASADLLLIATPAQVLGEVVARLPAVRAGTPGIICAKGIERATGRFMSEVLADVAPALEPYVLSGPSFAVDVVAGLPTAVTLAGRSAERAHALAAALSLESFRIYASSDIRGVEFGGAVKNVLAIACGISDGRGLGDSARAALTTRGFAELSRLGEALGARRETLTGLSGLGDLILTCSSPKSRNFSLGLALGRGEPLAAILEGRRGIYEGVYTAGVVTGIARRQSIEMPIAEAVNSIVEGRSTPDVEIARILSRPVKFEDR
jgi:glycerol-3-phosphate dehydrogenase (NAD(P)+)